MRDTGARVWVRLVLAESVPEGGMTASFGEESVLVLRSGGKIRALSGLCPHAGAPLEEGMLKDGVLTCPWHGGQFDAASGDVLHAPPVEGLRCYETRVAPDGWVEAQVPGRSHDSE